MPTRGAAYGVAHAALGDERRLELLQRRLLALTHAPSTIHWPCSTALQYLSVRAVSRWPLLAFEPGLSVE